MLERGIRKTPHSTVLPFIATERGYIISPFRIYPLKPTRSLLTTTVLKPQQYFYRKSERSLPHLDEVGLPLKKPALDI